MKKLFFAAVLFVVPFATQASLGRIIVQGTVAIGAAVWSSQYKLAYAPGIEQAPLPITCQASSYSSSHNKKLVIAALVAAAAYYFYYSHKQEPSESCQPPFTPPHEGDNAAAVLCSTPPSLETSAVPSTCVSALSHKIEKLDEEQRILMHVC